MALSSLAVSRRTPVAQSYTTLAVQYRDGLTLNYLFDRSTKIVELMATIHRAGRVRKVVLWDEMPERTRKGMM